MNFPSCCVCGVRTFAFTLCANCERDGHKPCSERAPELRCTDHRPTN